MRNSSIDWGRFGLIGLIALAAAAFIPTESALAGAWTREQNQYLLVVPMDYTVADKQFDENGDKVDRLKFQQIVLGPYMEFGLTDNFTMGAQANFRWVRQSLPMNDSAENTSLSDVSALARYRLWGEDAAAFSFQALVKIPADANELEAAALGFDQVDVEGSFLFGNAVPAGSGRVFYNVDLGYRKRFDTPSDEIHGNAYVGWSPGGTRWSFVLASNNTFGLDNEDNNVFEALTARPDYRRNQAQLSASYRVSERFSVVAGGNTTFSGRNVGVSHGAFIALVFSLDPSMIFGTEPYF
jgi:hypothetical protein